MFELEVERLDMTDRRRNKGTRASKRIKWFVKHYKTKYGIRLQRSTVKSKLIQKYAIKCRPGIPDYCYEQDGELIFVEHKTAGGGMLTYNQIKWLQDNPGHRTKIVFFECVTLEKEDFSGELKIFGDVLDWNNRWWEK